MSRGLRKKMTVNSSARNDRVLTQSRKVAKKDIFASWRLGVFALRLRLTLSLTREFSKKQSTRACLHSKGRVQTRDPEPPESSCPELSIRSERNQRSIAFDQTTPRASQSTPNARSGFDTTGPSAKALCNNLSLFLSSMPDSDRCPLAPA